MPYDHIADADVLTALDPSRIPSCRRARRSRRWSGGNRRRPRRVRAEAAIIARRCACSSPAGRASSAPTWPSGWPGATPSWELVAVDNLRRRGAELNLPRLRDAGVHFQHADVRVLDDLLTLGELDAVVECSAEPSALAGVDGSPDYVIQSNLVGAYHCLELARRRGAYMVFLSTSRVYPVAALNALALEETDTRLELAARAACSRRVAGRDRRGFPARRGPYALRLDQTRGRAADRGVPGGVRPARGDRPLRRDRRAVADGQGRSGRVHLLDARPPLPSAARLHRLRRAWETGPRPAARRGPARPARRATPEPRTMGRDHGQRRRRPRLQSLAVGDHSALRRDHGESVDSRCRGGDPAGRRPELHLGLHQAVRAHAVATSP